MAQLGDRVFFGLCALAGSLILVGSAQPGFELYLNASTGTGDGRRFSIQPLAGWRLVDWTVLAISLVVWFRASLLVVPRPWLAVPAFLAVLLVVAYVTLGWSLRIRVALIRRSPAGPSGPST